MATIQGIYVAIFGRPADPAGLAHWNEQTNNGADLSSMIGALTETDEFKALYDGKSNSEIITAVYQSLFGRAPDQAGLDHFLDGLADGTLNIESIAISILDGAQGDDKAIADNKITAADAFTASLDTQVEIDAYVGTDAAEAGRAFLAPITKEPATIPTQEAIDAAILAIVNPDGGQAPVDGGGGGGGGGGGDPDELDYGDGDVILLQNTTVQARYDFGPNDVDAYDPLGTALGAAEEAYSPEAPNGNVVLIQNMDILNQAADLIGDRGLYLLGEIADAFTTHIMPSYAAWAPDNIFVGLPNIPIDHDQPTNEMGDSTITGTLGNDVIVALSDRESSHTISGGRGQDVIVTADIDGFFRGGIRKDIVVDLEARLQIESAQEVTIGSHVVDGGDEDDIILNIGGDMNVLNGGEGNDLIVSIGEAQDTINGGAGNDIIFGGSDEEEGRGDTLMGGDGNDTFVYLPQGQIGRSGFEIPGLGDIADNGDDTILDFMTGEDTIALISNGTAPFSLGKGTGFASYELASIAASNVMHFSEDTHVYFAYDVGGDGYLFIDDNADHTVDFSIKLAGLTNEADFDVKDIELLDVSSLLDGAADLIGAIQLQSFVDVA